MKQIHYRLSSFEIRPYVRAKMRTIQEYATEHNLSESAVRYRIATHKLSAYKIFRRWYVFSDRER